MLCNQVLNHRGNSTLAVGSIDKMHCLDNIEYSDGDDFVPISDTCVLPPRMRLPPAAANGEDRAQNATMRSQWQREGNRLILTLRLLLSGALLSMAQVSHAQLGGFKCPLDGQPPVRQSDSEASEGGRFNSKRGADHIHGALDLNSKEGVTVKAALAGKIGVADPSWGAMGGTVIIDHQEGAYTIYGHLATVTVKDGAIVKTGDKIGTVGYTGNAAALKAKGLPAHLHFALVQAGQTGLADVGKPLRKMKDWGDMWKKEMDAQLTGFVNPVLFMGAENCWSGSATVGAPGEK